MAEYLAREIPHRNVAEQMLLEALPQRLERYIDLGTGDGRLLALVRSRYADAQGTGFDSSPPMLEQARARFDGDSLIELHEADLREPLPVAAPVDAVVSGLAIHHLSDPRKQELFGEIHDLLSLGGVFANLDLVRSASAQLHERFRREIGRIEDDPTDQLAGLTEQMTWLGEAGFTEVDCHFKWLELSLIVAVKGQAAT